jgi:hypothetical protein
MNLRKLILRMAVVACIAIPTQVISQNIAINSDGSNPDASAMLDVSSTSKGMLIPRMTSAQRTSIGSPANSLLVFDTSTASFWYYDADATSWSELSGSAGGSCYSLEEAYNCGGMGAGRSITTDYGAIALNMTSSASNTDALSITTNKGTTSTPGSGISISHSAHGTALYGEITKSDNLYSAIQGIVGPSNSNSSSTSFPSGVSGYYDGSGIGVGVWGESIGNGTSAGAGVYGLASNNNFGGHFESNNYPGINCKTNTSGAQALQVQSAGASYTNPAAQIVGWTQFDISNDFNCHSVIMNNLSGEPTIAPQTNSYGYLGTNSYAWYYLYYVNAVQVSRRETKRDITYLENNLGHYVIQDIKKMKPAFYKYKVETDKFDPDNPRKYRPNMHMGIILDEAPDYLKDNAFSGIDVYALATLGLAGVQQVNERVETLEQTVQDFGLTEVTTRKTYIDFSDDFREKLSEDDMPVVTVSPTQQGIHFSVEGQNENGFYLVADQEPEQEIMVNWIAMAKTCVKTRKPDIDENLQKQLDVPENVKTDAKKRFDHKQTEPMELINPNIGGSPKKTTSN